MDRREFMAKAAAATSMAVVSSLQFPQESDGDRNERMFVEAEQLLQRLARQPLNPSVVNDALEVVNRIGEWGHCAVYSSLFTNDTHQLAAECMAADPDSYAEYWPLLDEAEANAPVFVAQIGYDWSRLLQRD